MKAFLLLLSLLSLPGFATTIINECADEIFVAYAKDVNWGNDDLGASGSVSQRQSSGWFRVGPYQREESKEGYSHLLVTHKKNIISFRVRGTPDLLGACIHPDDAFERSVTLTDNTGRQAASNHPVSECMFVPGQAIVEGYATKWRWAPFQKIRGVSTYTVHAEDCRQNFTPAPLRHAWKMKGGDGTADERYFVWMDGDRWVLASPRPQGRDKEANLLISAPDTDEWISLKAETADLLYKLGTNKSQIFQNGNWLPLSDGYWRY